MCFGVEVGVHKGEFASAIDGVVENKGTQVAKLNIEGLHSVEVREVGFVARNLLIVLDLILELFLDFF